MTRISRKECCLIKTKEEREMEYTRLQLALTATVIIGLAAAVATGFNPMVPVVELIIEVAA